jgi:cobalt-zinc-cadmium efflux system protein
VNLAAVFVLRGHSHGLNARAAQLHVIGDLLGSIGVLAAAAAIMWMGWAWADPVASIGIGIIVIVGSIRVVLQSVHVLMEGAPRHLNAEHVRTALCGLPGVDDVHDLHLWSLGGRAPLLTAHLVVDHATKAKDVLRTATALLADRFGIDHVTLQIEPADFNIRGIGAPPVDSGHGSP